MFSAFISLFTKALPSIIDSLKWFGSMYTAKKYGKTKEQNKNLEKVNETQKKQLEIANRPPSRWGSILDWMRNNKR